MTRIFLRKHSHPALLFGIVALGSGGARAAPVPAVSVSSEGGCPSQQELVTALRSRGLSIGGSAQPTSYSIGSYREPKGAQLVLRRASGEVVLRRSFQSPHCTVLATAMAVVAEALFAELGETDDAPRPTEPAAASSYPDEQASPATGQHRTFPAGQPRSPTEHASTAPAPTNNKKPRLARTRGAPTEQPSTALPDPSGSTLAPASARSTAIGSSGSSLHPTGFLGMGPLMDLPIGVATAGALLVGGLEVSQVPLSLELALSSGLPAESRSAAPRVRRWASQGMLRVGVPLDSSRLRYRPWLALGDTFARLTALDFQPNSTRSTHSPTAGAGIEMGMPLTRRWSFGLDVGCLLLLARDRYLGDEAAADAFDRGPRVVCGANIGAAYRGND